MSTLLPKLHELPRRSASQVKNRWQDVVREVRTAGGVAVTNHSEVELVLVDAATYEALVSNAAAMVEREERVLQRLACQFDQRLAALQATSAPEKVHAVFAARGKLTRRPKAGPSC